MAYAGRREIDVTDSEKECKTSQKRIDIMESVLIVDDEAIVLQDGAKIIRDMGCRVLTANNGKEAIELISKYQPDVVLTDQKMPGEGGFDVLEAALKVDPDIPVVIFTGHSTVESAVQAMRKGAYDYIQKPFLSDMMETVLRRAIEYRKLKRENAILKTHVEETYKIKNLVYRSSIMRQIVKNVMKVAKTDANVFIFGESGTGKELIARAIHLNSPRKDNPFIPLDCVALPENLLESELFGFTKGAFTGAVQEKPGLFELAENGSLFLDEIIELVPRLQAKLLRVLQERQFRRIGGKEFVNVNIRIISATNRNPEEAVKEKKLREDLYYRLNVVPIYIPPLRDRIEDIPLMVHHFISKYNPFFPREIKGISNEAMNCLKKYSWPGNVRELENYIQRAMSMTELDTLQLDDMPDAILKSVKSNTDDPLLEMSFREARSEYLKRFGKKYISNLLKIYRGNVSKTARAAGVSRRTLYRMLEEYDIRR